MGGGDHDPDDDLYANALNLAMGEAKAEVKPAPRKPSDTVWALASLLAAILAFFVLLTFVPKLHMQATKACSVEVMK